MRADREAAIDAALAARDAQVRRDERIRVARILRKAIAQARESGPVDAHSVSVVEKIIDILLDS